MRLDRILSGRGVTALTERPEAWCDIEAVRLTPLQFVGGGCGVHTRLANVDDLPCVDRRSAGSVRPGLFPAPSVLRVSVLRDRVEAVPQGGGIGSEMPVVDVTVIGAGQAGLSAAHHLARRGFHPWVAGRGGPSSRVLTFVVVDANERPGGAWQHRWLSLTMATINGIYDLPGMAVPPFDQNDPAARSVPKYFARYEEDQGIRVRRPVFVRRVSRTDDDPSGLLSVQSSEGDWETRALINATGTWTRPFRPHYPGIDEFGGRQLHVADYVSATEFDGLHVAVVGGGISGVQLLEEISRVTTTTWFTRREPIWAQAGMPFDGRAAVARVEARVKQGLAPQSVVSVTDLQWTPTLLAAAERGVLHRNPMFTRIEPTGVRSADGAFLPVDVILWATGFRAALDHLAPLGLRAPGGGIVMNGTEASADPRVHLIGYGPSASTIGANRAGRAAAMTLVARLAVPSTRTAPQSA